MKPEYLDSSKHFNRMKAEASYESIAVFLLI